MIVARSRTSCICGVLLLLSRCVKPFTLCRPTVLRPSHRVYPKAVEPNVHITIVKGLPSENREPEWFGFPSESVAKPLALLLLSQFVLFLGVGAVIPSIPLYGKEIGLSSAANGIVISTPAIGLLLLANWSGKQADKARKAAMIWGMAIIAVADLGTACATNLPLLILARFGLGVGRSWSEAGERGMLADLAQRVESQRGKVVAAQQAVAALGIAIGAPVGGLLVEEYGPRVSFLCVSAAATICWLLYWFLPETIANSQSTENSYDVETETITSDSGDWISLLKERSWQGLALCQSGASFGFAAKIASIPILATECLPGGAAGTGLLLSAAGLTGLLGAPVGGFCTDKISARATCVLGGVISATGLISIPWALSLNGDSPFALFNNEAMSNEALAFSAVVLLWSFGSTAQGPALTAYAQELAPDDAKATAMALPRASGDGTYIVAPFILGLFADNFGVRGSDCALAGSFGLFGALSLLFSREKKQIE
ncbi:hypothetical protein FisN_21Hh045 [Fistulifera solaris]|uniref:Major facilitator superfamily (MFS) profile domain-containing protein n=1 Tax=Fistulifera solaris TaxID=1519565 RepID=A0A1Z5KAH8_FISSO|nr:hypothetical protein FisN_21Hh045 [Fistulifera solaris]|eukprot:GAX23270.1 hypothetical protein FisN_21Hh045 [Fistulifera solaris]